MQTGKGGREKEKRKRKRRKDKLNKRKEEKINSPAIAQSIEPITLLKNLDSYREPEALALQNNYHPPHHHPPEQ
jgi:hypothetical protein